MKKVSVRTLTVLVELLMAVVIYQWMDWTHSAAPGAVWLAGDCAEARQVQLADPCATTRSTLPFAQPQKAE